MEKEAWKIRAVTCIKDNKGAFCTNKKSSACQIFSDDTANEDFSLRETGTAQARNFGLSMTLSQTADEIIQD